MRHSPSNTGAATFLALATASLVITVLKLSPLGPAVKPLLPYADLWLALSAAIAVAVLLQGTVATSPFARVAGPIALFCFVVAVLSTLAVSGAFGFYYADETMGGPARRLLYLAPRTWLLTLACCAAFSASAWTRALVGRRWPGVFVGLIAVTVAIVAAHYNILVDKSPYADNPINLGVVLMPVVNVFFGALPPLDVQSQYGYYAYFIVPFLKLTGLSLFAMSMVLASLFFLCFAAIYLFGRWATGSAILGLAAMVAGLFLNTSFGNLWPAELYYQYRPIRMLAPCVALLLFMWHAAHPSRARRLLALGCLSLLVIWNSDSGIPTLAAFLLVLAFGPLFVPGTAAAARIRAMAARSFEGVLVLCATLGVFAAILFLLRGEWVTPALFFEPLRIWRMDPGHGAVPPEFFVSWANPALLLGLVHGTAVVVGLSRGAAGTWQRGEQALVLVGLAGLGLATYGAWRAPGTPNPQAAALTAFLVPLALAQLAVTPVRRDPTEPIRPVPVLVSIACLLPIAFLCASFVLHLKGNYGRNGIPSVLEITHPGPGDEKPVWIVPGPTSMDVAYVKVKDLAGSAPPVPPWVAKAAWLQSLAYLNRGDGTSVFIASIHDHYLYAALARASPVRIVNYYHVAIFRYWPLLFAKTQTTAFDYVVVDHTFLLRHNDSQGTGNPDTFLRLVEENYEKVDEKAVGADWHYPGWMPSVVSVYRRKK